VCVLCMQLDVLLRVGEGVSDKRLAVGLRANVYCMCVSYR